MKFSKWLMLILSAVTAVSGQADDGGITYHKNAVSMTCQGPLGTLDLEIDPTQKTFELAVVINGASHLIKIGQSFASYGETPSVSTSSFKSEGDSKNYVDFYGDYEKPVWNGPSEGCLPTRVTGQCFPEHNPGYWSTATSHWISVQIQALDTGTYALNMVDGKEFGLPQNPIGENATCEVFGL